MYYHMLILRSRMLLSMNLKLSMQTQTITLLKLKRTPFHKKMFVEKIVNRVTDWKHWPFSVFYFPLFFAWAWYCIKSRSMWFFSTSNPTLTFGGFEGETKKRNV